LAHIIPSDITRLKLAGAHAPELDTLRLLKSALPDDYLKAVNLGDDADTAGAIYGQLAGAFHGVDRIPERWRKILFQHDIITGLADGLLSLSITCGNAGQREQRSFILFRKSGMYGVTEGQTRWVLPAGG